MREQEEAKATEAERESVEADASEDSRRLAANPAPIGDSSRSEFTPAALSPLPESAPVVMALPAVLPACLAHAADARPRTDGADLDAAVANEHGHQGMG